MENGGNLYGQLSSNLVLSRPRSQFPRGWKGRKVLLGQFAHTRSHLATCHAENAKLNYDRASRSSYERLLNCDDRPRNIDRFSLRSPLLSVTFPNFPTSNRLYGSIIRVVDISTDHELDSDNAARDTRLLAIFTSWSDRCSASSANILVRERSRRRSGSFLPLLKCPAPIGNNSSLPPSIRAKRNGTLIDGDNTCRTLRQSIMNARSYWQYRTLLPRAGHRVLFHAW